MSAKLEILKAAAKSKPKATRGPGNCDALDAAIAKQAAQVSALEQEAEAAREREQARQVEQLAKIDERAAQQREAAEVRIESRRTARREKVLERGVCQPPAPRKPRTKKPKPETPPPVDAAPAVAAIEAVFDLGDAATPAMRPVKSCEDMCDVTMRGSVACGAKTVITLAAPFGGAPRLIPARYCLVHAKNLIPSHDAMTFAPHARYPRGVQERQYDRDTHEQMKVINIAQNPEPSVIWSTAATPVDGPPIVTPEGIALGGNGRTMGIQRHYGQGGRVLSDSLRRLIWDFGLRPEELDRIPVHNGDGPVVVRVIDIPRDQWPAMVRDLNTALTQAMDAVAESVALARQLPPTAFEVLAQHLAEDDLDLGTFLASPKSDAFVQALRKARIITSSNANRMLRSDGRLTDDARTLIVRALGSAVVPDAELLDAVGAEIRGSLARSAPFWLAAGVYGAAWDVREPMTRALRDFLGVQELGLGLRRWLQQQALFEPPATAGDPIARLLLVMLETRRGPVQMTRIARPFASAAAQSGGRQTALVDPPTPVEALEGALRAGGVDVAQLLGGAP